MSAQRVGVRGWVGPLVAVSIVGLVSVAAVLQLDATIAERAQLSFGDRLAPLMVVMFAVTAGVVTARRPRLTVGWFLLGFAGFIAVTGSAIGTASLLGQRGGPASWRDAAAWVQAWSWLPAVSFLALALLHFPDGTLPTAAWRWVRRIDLAVLLATTVLAALVWPLRGPALLDTDRPLPGAAGAVVEVVTLAAAAGVLLSVSSLFVRWRRSSGVVRLQMRWLLLASGVVLVALLATIIGEVLGAGGQLWADVLGAIGLLLVPLAIGAAVLRYRLFEIDRIISRTVAWVLVTTVLGAVYVAGVLGVRTLLPASGDLAVALSTLAAASLFQPLRHRVQRMVDRRFDRVRYDATRTIDGFGRSLRDEVSRDAITDSLREVVSQTFGASMVGLVVLQEDSS